MPGFSPPPVQINNDPTRVGYEFLGQTPAAAGAAGIVAERVGHVHAVGRTIRQTAGMGLYQDIQGVQDNSNSYMVTNVGAIPALGAWTFETWFYGGNGVIGGAEIGWQVGFYKQGTAVATPNPDPGSSPFPFIGFKNQGGGGGGAQFQGHDGTTITLTGVTTGWNHLAATWDGVRYHAFANGTLIGSYTPSSAPALSGLLAGFGAWATSTFVGRVRLAQTRVSSLARYTATFTPAQVPFTPDSNTVALWNYSDVPLGNWGVYYESGGTSPAPGGQPLASGWHWTPSVAFDSSGNGRDLGVALLVSSSGGDRGSAIYSAGVAGITAADAVVGAPAVTSLQAMTGDVTLVDSTGAALAPTPGTPGKVTLPAIPALDATAGDIQPVAGAAAAGSVGKAADAGHQHVGVHSITAGTNVTLGGTASDPIISASGGGGGGGGGAPRGAILGSVFYAPSGSHAYSTTSTTFAEVDGTNLKVSFVAPPSGNVVIQLSASAHGNTSTYVQWAVGTSGGSVTASTKVLVAPPNTSEGVFTAVVELTGLTPGTTYTYSWWWACFGGTNGINMYAGDGTAGEGAASMVVYDATVGTGGVVATSGLLGVAADVAANEGTASTSFTGLTTASAVTFTVPASGAVIVEIESQINNSTGSMGFAVSGTDTVAASDNEAITNAGTTQNVTISGRFRITGLTPGATDTVTAQYKALTGTCDFTRRRLAVYDGTLGGVTGDVAWTAPTLTNSWANVGGSWAPAGFRKDALGFVHLRGSVMSGAVATSVFTLPVGYRPSSAGQLAPPCTTGAGAFGWIQLMPNGQVIVGGASATTFVSLDGITFLAEQ